MEQEYPFPTLHEVVNGKNVSILGAWHEEDFLEEHKQFFENFVAKQDVLVLEQPVDVNFWEEKDFFKGIGEFAREQNKKIYQIDPITESMHSTDVIVGILGMGLMYSGLKKCSKKLSRRNFLKKLGVFGIGLSLSAGSLPGMMLTGKID